MNYHLPIRPLLPQRKLRPGDHFFRLGFATAHAFARGMGGTPKAAPVRETPC
jgi:hypothetical protein